MNHDSPEYQKMLAELKNDYIKGLQGKLEAIQIAVEARDTAVLREHFHKFKGNGKTYGFPAISIVGELTEKLIIQSEEKGLEASQLALRLLKSIYEKELDNKGYEFEEDPNLAELRALA
tara:strand:- start:262 stop:618 length:357 start_codon:yes stop_codon:yes gene_type:complete